MMYLEKYKTFFRVPRDMVLIGAVVALVVLVVAAIFADVIARDGGDFIAFSPETSYRETKIYQSPGFEELASDGTIRKHVLGTDQQGRDVAARLIHGTRVALLVGGGSTMISLLIAIFLGSVAGYYGDRSIRYNLVDLFIGGGIVVMAVLLLTYNGVDVSGTIDIANVITILIGMGLLLFVTIRYSPIFFSRSHYLPLDTIVVKLLEVFRAIPGLFLILAIFSLIEKSSLWTVIWVIGILRWGTMTRILRAEMIRLKSEPFVASLKVSGLPDRIILLRHMLPNSIGPLIVSVCFYFSSAILIEASLSFLGIGVPIDIVSWGGMLNASRMYIGAWWMAIFPGALIFATILIFTVMGEWFKTSLKKGRWVRNLGHN